MMEISPSVTFEVLASSGAEDQDRRQDTSKRPKVLCLHGGATSARIFRHQLKMLEATLGDRAELVFVDGRNQVSQSQPEVERAFPGGPFFVHMQRVMDEEPETTETMGTYVDKDEGIAWLMDVLDQQGPFFAWIGFSQGANLALMALHHLSTQRREPLRPSLRWPRAVVFMCPTQFGWFDPGTPPFHSDSIHIMVISGKLDPRIARSRAFIRDCLSQSLLTRVDVVEHPEGHRPLPGEPVARQEVVDVIVQELLKDRSTSS